MTATNISENASETMKKFCTVRSGRNVKTERITRILPHMHKITMDERTNTKGNISLTDMDFWIAATAVVVVLLLVVVVDRLIRLNGEGKTFGMFKFVDDIKYQSIVLLGSGKRI